jgi:uncharacterized membrane protein
VGTHYGIYIIIQNDTFDFFHKESHNIVRYWPNTGSTFNDQTQLEKSSYAIIINKDGRNQTVKFLKYYQTKMSN